DPEERQIVEPTVERIDVAGLDDAVHEQAHCAASLAVAATSSATSTSIRSMSATASVTWPWTTTPPASTRSIRSTRLTGCEEPARALVDAYSVRAVLTRPLRSSRARSCRRATDRCR